MYDELVKSLRQCAEGSCAGCKNDLVQIGCRGLLQHEAADAIEELSAKVNSLQFFANNISKLPDCNTCLKKNLCEFMPKYGEYCRINCPAWLGELPKEKK